MAFVRRHTEDDATWTRAWTADTLADLTSISAIKGSERPHHGDIAFVTSESKYYSWMDDDSWLSIDSASTTLPPYYDYVEGIPANPAADTVRLYAVDFNGFTFLEERDSAGRIIRPNRDTVAVGKVDEVGGIARGQVVRVSGASGTVRLLKKALATDRANTPGFGLAMDAGAQNAFIRVLTSGLLGQLDTSGIAEGARVFLSATTAGALTVTAPIAPNLTQRMGYVLRQHATQGEIAVLPATALSESGWEAVHASMHASTGRDPLSVLTLGGYPGGSTTFLRADGTFVSPVGGSNTQIQFNDSGVFGGNSGLTFNKTTGALTVSGAGPHVFGGPILRSVDDLAIGRNTTAGSDNGYVSFSAASDRSSSRTSAFFLYGNQVPTTGGSAKIGLGNPVGSVFEILKPDLTVGLSLTNTGVLTVNGFGTHLFSAAGTGSNVITVRNTALGTTNYAAVRVGNDSGSARTELATFSASYTTGSSIYADGSRLYAEGGGGLSLVAAAAGGVIRFYTGGHNEYARIDNLGQFLIGRTTAVPGSGVVQIQSANPSLNWALNLRHAVNVNGGFFIGFLNASDAVQGSITSGGTGTTVAYNTSSDKRLKTDLGLAKDIAKLRAITVHDFFWKSDGSIDRGIFAQDTQSLFPRAITVGTDELTEDGYLKSPWMVDYSKFVPDLIVGWQQHDTIIRAVLARLIALEEEK